MNLINDDEDDKFMAQFTHRLRQEPIPEWPLLKQKSFPWLEIGWAAAASLFLFMYWPQLEFGAETLFALGAQQLARVSISWVCAGLAGAFAALQWFSPKSLKLF